MSIEAEAIVRQRNQVTIPGEVVGKLGVHEGDRVLFVLEEQDDQVILRPIRQSYRGALKGVYGNSAHEVQEYVNGERAAWE